MPGLARLVLPKHPHHVVQRGVRSIDIFRRGPAGDADRETYLRFAREECARHGCSALAWCLMTNHVHLLLVPERAESLALAVGSAHRRYTREKNLREGVRGRLFQGRFLSYVLDENHLMAAARYVELNPVSARIVRQPGEYAWSSARFHLGKRKTDPLVEDRSLSGTLSGARAWRRFLSDGVAEIERKRIEERMSSGLPLGTDEFVKGLEEETGRVLVPQTGGWPKGRPRRRGAGGN
jgi:putative transposase